MFSLLTLPITIVEDIVEAICFNPVNRDAHSSIELDKERQSRAALASLCRTSKTLQLFATPLLYQRPVCHSTQEVVSFARTIIQQPDLARHVKVLRQGSEWYLSEEDLTQDDLKLFTDEATEFTEPELLAELLEDWLSHGRLFDLVVANCINIEEAAFETYYSEAGFAPPCSLVHLRTLSLAHGDTEMGCSLPGIEAVLDAAPKITTLNVTCATSVGISTRLKKLTTLNLNDCVVDEDELCSLLGNCPKLETLHYSAGGPTVSDESGLSPAEFQNAVSLHAPRLKSLVFDIQEAMFHDIEEDMLMRSLKSLTQLDHLSIDTRSLVVHQDPGTGRSIRMPDGTWQAVPFVIPDPDPMVLVNLLPTCIRSFRFSFVGGPKLGIFLPAIVRLARAVGEVFPDLKTVAFPGLPEEDAKEARTLFEAQGISFSVEY